MINSNKNEIMEFIFNLIVLEIAFFDKGKIIQI